MDTTISLPEETFTRVEQRAQELGMSRSEFLTRAAERYLAELDAENLTDHIDAVISQIDVVDSSSTIAVELGRDRLASIQDEW